MDFIAKNWVNMCLVFVGSFALVIYIERTAIEN